MVLVNPYILIIIRPETLEIKDNLEKFVKLMQSASSEKHGNTSISSDVMKYNTTLSGYKHKPFILYFLVIILCQKTLLLISYLVRAPQLLWDITFTQQQQQQQHLNPDNFPPLNFFLYND